LRGPGPCAATEGSSTRRRRPCVGAAGSSGPRLLTCATSRAISPNPRTEPAGRGVACHLRRFIAGCGQGGPWYRLPAEAVLAHHRGEQGRAIRSIGELAQFADESGSDAELLYIIGRFQVLFGDRRAGLRMLERAVDRGFFAYPRLASDPFLTPLRNDSTFQQVLARAKTRHEAFRALVAAQGLPQ
jgi:hypothetical protein